MRQYTEKDLESFIEAHLLESGYVKRKQKDYDKNLCMDMGLFLSFLESSQKNSLEKLEQRGIRGQELLKRVALQISEKGILKALQTHIEIMGIRISLAYPKPYSSNNPQSIEKYKKNIFSIVRQLHFSEKNNKSLDMVIFLNGLPIITMELKNPLTHQNVYDAIEQYKRDRDPRERLFRQSVVHFALDSDEVHMSTKLEGKDSKFLPFNRGLNNGSGAIGSECGSGNPALENKMKTSYFWEEILQKDKLINLLFNFASIVKKDGKEVMIFPRFHQFDAVRKLLKDVKEKGVGQRYLIQHSAGSGKSNSIAWLAHNLANLHRIENGRENNVFGSVLVVTDRRVLDRQIQEIVKSFTQEKNLVEAITDGSRQLKDAIEEGKKIIITTIQKFPYIADEITHLQNKTFAIIIDEAHSSQSGEASQKLNEAISNKNDKESDEMDLEEKLIKIIKERKFQPNASYFAFTATPSPKTLEMFGTSCYINGKEKFIPFHLYSMKQAIEENCIFDVLKGYVTYDNYYQIVSRIDDKKYDKSKAIKKLKRYVTRHDKTIKAKAEIMIKHFFQNIYKKINHKAKAMVVTESRESAVKYYLFFRKYLQDNHKDYKALVAFSGDIEVDGESYKEDKLNGFSPNVLKDKFKEDCYRFLIVADKYQTGFDEPLLHTMYVDKSLRDINAVQTLSRLNRKCQHKEDTCVLDFRNTHEQIKKSFSPFYEQTHLEEPTNFEHITSLKNKLLQYGIYTQDELDNFIDAILDKQSEDIIHSKLDNIIKTYNKKSDDIKMKFYTEARAYLKHYAFLAQILPFCDTKLERLYHLLDLLTTKITPPYTEDLARGIRKNVTLESICIKIRATKDIRIDDNKGGVKPTKPTGSSQKEIELERLLDIVKAFNDRFGNTEFEADKMAKDLVELKDKILENQTFKDSLSDESNSRRLFPDIFNQKYATFYQERPFLKQLGDRQEEFRKEVYWAILDMILNPSNPSQYIH